jgi:hypothetical protein
MPRSPWKSTPHDQAALEITAGLEWQAQKNERKV